MAQLPLLWARNMLPAAMLLEQQTIGTRRTSKDVIVPAEVLGGGVQHQVCAQVQRSLVHGRCKGAVYAHQGAVPVTERCDGRHIHASQEWVGRGLCDHRSVSHRMQLSADF